MDRCVTEVKNKGEQWKIFHRNVGETEECCPRNRGDECRNYSTEVLECVPDELLNMSDPLSLGTLILARNQIYSFNAGIYQFTSLRILDLSRNRIRSVPEGISALCCLEELNLLSNKLKISTLPLEELAAMDTLLLVDLRYNEKLQKEEASKLLLTLFGDRVRVRNEQRREQGQVDSACERDCDLLQDQLAPWSTPQLRTRLLELFGARMDPEEPRPVVMQTLLRHYERQGPRQIRHAQGRPLQPSIAAALTSCLRSLAWPLTTRERPTVQADKYFTLQRPQTKFTAEGGAKARLNAAKLERYAELWELVNDAIRSVDPQYADSFTGVAITKGFRDSPHIDTENVGPFYGLSLGNFCGGGGIAVESGPHEVTVLDTFERFGKVDGRYPHWVTKYTGERYSVICYRTTGEVSPMGPAVCPV